MSLLYNFEAASDVLSAFVNVCKRLPHGIAVDDQGSTCTYQTLLKKVAFFREHLVHKNIANETPIVVLLPRGLHLVTSVLSVMAAGLAYVPLDVSHPNERLNYICKHTRAPYIITCRDYAEKLPTIVQSLICQAIYIDSIMEAFEDSLVTEHQTQLSSLPLNTLAYIIYTSGSTGEPKGVAVEHRGICNFIRAQIEAFNVLPQSRLLQFLPICFDASISEMFVALLSGAQLCFLSMEEYADKALASKIFPIIERRNFNVACLPPAFLPFLPIESTPACLKTVIIGGEVCSAKEIDRWRKKVRLVNVYGPTEATVCTSMQIYEPEGAFESTSIGKPIPNTELLVLDEDMNQTDDGELYIIGPGVARGYFRDDILTAAKFVHHNGRLMYKTGDRVAKKPDGDILFLGRVDDQVKLRGQRIELQEIENQLLHYPSIKQAKVILTEEGENSHLVAFVVVERHLVFSEKDTKEYLATKVPHYMVPSEFIALEELSRNNNEKIDRKKLKEIYKQRKLADQTISSSSRKEVLKKIISDIVHSELNDEDSLFDLGINSITIVQLIQRAKQEGIDLSLNDILNHKTIGDLIGKVNTQKKTLVILTKDLLDDCHIRVNTVGQNTHTSVKNILLTGATGYLGSYLLRDLIDQASHMDATITCLVRSSDAKDKISAKIKSINFSIVVGDVALPNLGLAQQGAEYNKLLNEVDTVYHCAGNVNVILPYDVLKKTNVEGARNIIEFCTSGKYKRLHYVSTLSVFTSTNTSKQVIDEADLVTEDTATEIYGGYAASKWVAERMVESAIKQGLEAVIYRPGLVANHSTAGDYANDWLARLLRQCAAMKLRPDFDTCQTDVTPVDYVSKTIVSLSLTASNKKIHHLANQKHILVNELFELFKTFSGCEWKVVPFSEWQEELKKSNQSQLEELQPLFTSLSFGELETLLFPAKKFQFICSNFTCPEASLDLLRPFFAKLV